MNNKSINGKMQTRQRGNGPNNQDSVYMSASHQPSFNRTASMFGSSRIMKPQWVLTPEAGFGRRSRKPLGITVKKRADGLDEVKGYFPESDTDNESVSTTQDQQENQDVLQNDEEVYNQEEEDEEGNQDEEDEECNQDHEELPVGFATSVAQDWRTNVPIAEEDVIQAQRIEEESETDEGRVDAYFNKEVFGMESEPQNDMANESDDDMEEREVSGYLEEEEESAQVNANTINQTVVRDIAVGTEDCRVSRNTANATIGTNTSLQHFVNREDTAKRIRHSSKYEGIERGARNKSLAGMKRKGQRHVSDYHDYCDEDRRETRRAKQRRPRGRNVASSPDSSTDSESVSPAPTSRVVGGYARAGRRVAESSNRRTKPLQVRLERNDDVRALRNKRQTDADRINYRHVKESSRKKTHANVEHHHAVKGNEGARRRTTEPTFRPTVSSPPSKTDKRRKSSLKPKMEEPSEASGSDQDMMDSGRYDRLQNMRGYQQQETARTHLTEVSDEEPANYRESVSFGPKTSVSSKKRARKSVQFQVSTPRNEISVHPDISLSAVPGVTPIAYNNRRLSLANDSMVEQEKEEYPQKAQSVKNKKKRKSSVITYKPGRSKKKSVNGQITNPVQTATRVNETPTSTLRTKERGTPLAKSKHITTPVETPTRATPKSAPRTMKIGTPLKKSTQRSTPTLFNVTPVSILRTKKHGTPLSLQKSRQRFSIKETPIDMEYCSPLPIREASFSSPLPIREASFNDFASGSVANSPQPIMEEARSASRKSSSKKSLHAANEMPVLNDDMEGINTLPGRSDSDSSIQMKPAAIQPDPKKAKKRGPRLNMKKRTRKPKMLGLEVSESKMKKFLEENEDQEQPRRGTRNRIRPVDLWKASAHIDYDRRLSGPVIRNVVRGEKTPVTQKKRITQNYKTKTAKTCRTAKESSESEAESMYEEVNPYQFVNGDNEEKIEMSIVHTPDMLRLEAPPLPDGTAMSNMLLHKYWSHRVFGAGFLVLLPKAEKGLQFVPNDTLLFFIVKGKVDVTVANTTQRIGKNSSFFIPSGNTYNIRNIRDEEAKLHFVQIKG